MPNPVVNAATRGDPAGKSWLAIAGLIVLIALGYRNALPGTFVLDDQASILENESIRRLASIRDVWWPPPDAGVGGRPLANVTFAVNHAIGGLAPWIYHATNVAFHAAAALVLFAIIRRTLTLPLLRDRFGRDAVIIAFAAAAMWALHPLQTAVVDYVSQRTEQLMALCYLTALYSWIRAATGGTTVWYFVAVAACAAGMASKEVMVTAPLILAWYDRTFLAASLRAVWIRRGRWYIALASTWVLLAGLMVASHLSARGVGFGAVSPFLYAVTEAHAVLIYIARVFWPQPLVFDYGWCFSAIDGTSLIELALIMAAIGGAVLMSVRQPAAGFGLAWFVIVLAPTSSFVPIVHQPVAETRVYLPLAGIAGFVAVGLYRALGRSLIFPVLLVGVPAVALTCRRNADYQDPVTLWRDTVAKRPDNARAYNNLAGTLLNEHRATEALGPATQAVRLKPDYAGGHVNLGAALLAAGQLESARAEYAIAAQLEPLSADAQAHLGNVLLLLGRAADARGPLEAAIRLDPSRAQPHNDLAALLVAAGDFERALREADTAIRLAPTMADAHYNRGNALARLQQLPAALQAFDVTLQLKPDYANAFNNRGVVLLNLGRVADATKSFEAALKCEPGHRDAQRNLERARRAVSAP